MAADLTGSGLEPCSLQSWLMWKHAARDPTGHEPHPRVQDRSGVLGMLTEPCLTQASCSGALPEAGGVYACICTGHLPRVVWTQPLGESTQALLVPGGHTPRNQHSRAPVCTEAWIHTGSLPRSTLAHAASRARPGSTEPHGAPNRQVRHLTRQRSTTAHAPPTLPGAWPEKRVLRAEASCASPIHRPRLGVVLGGPGRPGG